MEERFEILVGKRQLDFFVSYKWNDLGEEEADRICDQLTISQINPIRDKIRLEYGNSITQYMRRICVCDGVVLIINNDYFASLNCMYEGIITLLYKKNCAIIRIQETNIFNSDFKKNIVKYWNEFDDTALIGQDHKKWEIVSEHVQDFISWISDTNSVNPDDFIQFTKQLNKHIADVFLNNTVYTDMVAELITSKRIEISRVCDPGCEEYYQYQSIDYTIQESPVKALNALYNFVIHLKKFDSDENVKIAINNVAGIEPGSLGAEFSKYYFCMPTQESLDKCAFMEHIGRESTKLEYIKRRIIIYL